MAKISLDLLVHNVAVSCTTFHLCTELKLDSVGCPISSTSKVMPKGPQKPQSYQVTVSKKMLREKTLKNKCTPNSHHPKIR